MGRGVACVLRRGGVRARAAVEAADAHARGVKAFVKAFRADDGGAWATPAVYACVDDARAFAERADEDLKRRGEKPSKLADVGSTLMLAAERCRRRRRGRRRRRSCTWNALKVYFKLNALHLCKNLINAVNLPTFLPFDSFPKSEKVTYNFYVGRLAVFEDACERAAAHLEYAFENCHAQSRKNVRLILQYRYRLNSYWGCYRPSDCSRRTKGASSSTSSRAARRGDARLQRRAPRQREHIHQTGHVFDPRKTPHVRVQNPLQEDSRHSRRTRDEQGESSGVGEISTLFDGAASTTSTSTRSSASSPTSSFASSSRDTSPIKTASSCSQRRTRSRP